MRIPTLILLLSTLAAADPYEGYGVLGGLNLTRFSQSQTGVNGNGFIEDQGRKAGFFANIFWEIPLSSRFSLVPGISYLSKGSSSALFNVSLSYLEFPLLFRMVEPMGDSQFFLTLGPTFGLLMSGEHLNNTTSRAQDAKGYYRPSEIGIVAGFGIETPMDKWNLIFGINYAFGLSEVQPSSLDDAYTLKNGGFCFYAGIRLQEDDDIQDGERRALRFARKKKGVVVEERGNHVRPAKPAPQEAEPAAELLAPTPVQEDYLIEEAKPTPPSEPNPLSPPSEVLEVSPAQ